MMMATRAHPARRRRIKLTPLRLIVATLLAGSFRPAAVPVTSGFEPVLLSRVRCSA